MSAIATFLKSGAAQCRNILLAAACVCSCLQLRAAAPAFVYETPSEFLSAGDFNGDGTLDVLVLDKSSGNARVGYADSNGDLTWSMPLVTGVGDASGCAVGRFLNTNRDSVAVTAPALNEVNLVDLSETNASGLPLVVTPNGIGPHTLVPLANPLGGVAPPYNDLLVASSNNSGSAELLDLMTINAGVGAEAEQFGESEAFDRGNAVQLSITPATFAGGVVRGSNDMFDLWQFTNAPSPILSYSNLPSGSDYAFGLFNSETLPRFLFYLPGSSNVTVVSLHHSAGLYSFGAATTVAVSEPIQGVFYVNGGSFMILFGDGAQGLRFPNGTATLSSIYRTGEGSAGNVFTGIVPLANGQFALLDGPAGGTASAHAQVVHFNGTNFTKLSSGNLPPVTSRTTRANVWLFETEPFVNRQAGFIASFNTPDWSDGVSGLPGSLTVTVENDNGVSSGLGTPGTSNLGGPPAGSIYGLPNQYLPVISLFSYASPQTAQSVTVTISPPPGIYDGPIQISFFGLHPSDKIYYRVGAGDAWHLYGASFLLTNDNTISYYGTNASRPTRSSLQSATYALGLPPGPTPTVNLGNGTTTTNPPPSFVLPTNVILSPLGTIFYGRRSTTNSGSIWAINYDGSDDAYITEGVRPRASRDGRWLAFLRGGDPFDSHGDVWLRNMQSGAEQRLFLNSDQVVSFAWEPDDASLVLDYACAIWRVTTNGGFTELITSDCYNDAPALNPVDNRIAFHNLNPNNPNAGLYVAAPDGSDAQEIVPGSLVPGASWPAWSWNGQWISFVDGNSASSLDSGINLWVVQPSGTNLSRICDFSGTSNRFPHGAIWSPDSSALVGAATLFGTNGLWIVPLNADRTDCMGTAILLPTTPGDSIDFAGSIVVPPPSSNPPLLFLEPGINPMVIYWSTNFASYKLQFTTSLNPPIVWHDIPGPYAPFGLNLKYLESISPVTPAKFFRLAQ